MKYTIIFTTCQKCVLYSSPVWNTSKYFIHYFVVTILINITMEKQLWLVSDEDYTKEQKQIHHRLITFYW